MIKLDPDWVRRKSREAGEESCMAGGGEFRITDQPSFLAGYLKGLASRLGGDDQPILIAAAEYIEGHADEHRR